MLIAPNRQTVIVTPTKTGTYSVEACLLALGWIKSRPRHSSNIPVWLTQPIPDVRLTMRNPYARLLSMFTYGFVSGHSTIKRWANNDTSCAGFTEFLKNWLHAKFDETLSKRHSDWTMLYTDYFYKVGEDERTMKLTVHRIEDGTAALMESLGLPEPKEVFVNKSYNKLKVDDPWHDANVELVKDVIKCDLQLGLYDEDPYKFLLQTSLGGVTE